MFITYVKRRDACVSSVVIIVRVEWRAVCARRVVCCLCASSGALPVRAGPITNSVGWVQNAHVVVCGRFFT